MKNKDADLKNSPRDENSLIERIYRKIMPKTPFFLDALGRATPGANLLLAAREFRKAEVEKMLRGKGKNARKGQ